MKLWVRDYYFTPLPEISQKCPRSLLRHHLRWFHHHQLPHKNPHAERETERYRARNSCIEFEKINKIQSNNVHSLIDREPLDWLVDWKYGEGRPCRREIKEDRADVVFHGGDGGVAACVVAAFARRHWRCARAVRTHLQLHLHRMLRSQRAFATIRFQKLLDRYSSRLRC